MIESRRVVEDQKLFIQMPEASACQPSKTVIASIRARRSPNACCSPKNLLGLHLGETQKDESVHKVGQNPAFRILCLKIWIK